MLADPQLTPADIEALGGGEAAHEVATLSFAERATALADAAASGHEPWTRALGPMPTGSGRRAVWKLALSTLAVYRDRYQIDGADPLGPAGESQAQRLDRQRAATALQHTGTDSTRHGSQPRGETRGHGPVV